MEVYERGATAVADSLLEPNQPQYADIEKRVARYPYDPRRALQILDGLGFRQGSDGALRDAAGQPLAFEARTPDVGPNQQMNLAVVADWKAVGLSPDIVVVPRQRLGDNEYRWTFPSFELTKRAHDVKSLANFHSSQTPLPENHFLGSNVSRYMSPEFDRMLDRYFSTISVSERTKALGDIVATFSENVLALGLFYDHEPALVANRIQNVVGAHRLDTTETWNADKWDVD